MKLKPFEMVRFEDASPELYTELGFKSGIEFHQQLLTQKKLFCHCPAGLYSEDYDAAIIRHMRPTLSEMGTYDGTALMEFKKQKEVLYLLKNESVCTYEMDDTPPFLINKEALEKTIKISMLFECDIIGELHIMRKQYLDGSIPTGFQRTTVVGINGKVPLSDGRIVRIRQINLEEDACREVSDRGHRITFKTDRLSMPLIEVITEADITDPRMAYEAARRIQAITRYSGFMRRGIGASREDVNASIAGGSRVEIKGVPRIPYIPKLLHYEAMRQKIFLDLKKEIARRGILKDAKSIQIIDLTSNPTVKQVSLWADAKCIMGVIVREFKDLFSVPIQINRTFADDVSSILYVVSCMDKKPNIIFKPQPDYGGPNEHQWKKLREEVNIGLNDLLAVVWGNTRDTKIAANEIAERIIAARDVGVPNETRKAERGGVTTFERVLPGPDRMYPDTDHPPVPLEAEYLDSLKPQIPVSPWNREKIWLKLGLPWQLIFDLLHDNIGNLFDELISETQIRPTILAIHLTQTIRYLKRKGFNTGLLTDLMLVEIFKNIDNLSIPMEAISNILARIAQNEDLAEILETYKPITDEQAKEIIDRKINSYRSDIKTTVPKAIVRASMGHIMHFLRGKYPGYKLLDLVKQEVQLVYNNQL